MKWWKRKPKPVVYDVPADHIPVIQRAIMLIETAWLDIEPIPCEVEAVHILKNLVERKGGANGEVG
jgi:hypothetical protein